MAFCPNCGSPVEEGAAACPVCGMSLYNGANQTPAYNNYQPSDTVPAGPYYSPQSQQVPPTYNYQQMYYQQANPVYQELRNKVSSARTLGILCIVFAFLNTLVSIILGCIGISKANAAIQSARMYNDPSLLSEAVQAKKYSKIGLIITGVMIGFFVLLIVLVGVLGASGALNDYM